MSFHFFFRAFFAICMIPSFQIIKGHFRHREITRNNQTTSFSLPSVNYVKMFFSPDCLVHFLGSEKLPACICMLVCTRVCRHPPCLCQRGGLFNACLFSVSSLNVLSSQCVTLTANTTHTEREKERGFSPLLLWVALLDVIVMLF